MKLAERYWANIQFSAALHAELCIVVLLSDYDEMAARAQALETALRVLLAEMEQDKPASTRQYEAWQITPGAVEAARKALGET